MSKPKYALDSCSILHLLVKTPKWYAHLRPMYEDAKAGQIILLVSEISVTECFKLTTVDGQPIPDGRRVIQEFFSHSFIERRGFTSRESKFAADLVLSHRIGTCDAIIAATAVYADCTTLYTTDGCSPRPKPGKLITMSEVKTPCGKQMDIFAPDHRSTPAT